jgi:molybdopterin-synthase adenylyltransferase
VTDRYHRQILLPQIRPAGQDRLSAATVMLVGVGALGCTIADQLARAGVSHLVLIDRDVIDLTNLQRQTLFAEADVGRAKAVVAAGHLAKINSSVRLTPLTIDVTSDNVRALIQRHRPTILLDGTDNAAVRYLINDAAIDANLPWVYGACVGVEGRVMPVVPGKTPCLRCVFETPPAAGELPTCDTAGVLGAAASVVASLQAAEAIRYLVSGEVLPAMTTVDVWSRRFRTIDLASVRRDDCPACGRRDFQFLRRPADHAATLCGRNTVQIRLADVGDDFLARVAARARPAVAETTADLVRFVDGDLSVTAFADGRVLIQGTGDVAAGRSLVAKWLG